MKKWMYLCLSVLFISLITSCSVGVKKDLLSGVTITNKGLSFEKYQVFVDDVEKQTNEASMNQKMTIQLTGVSGYAIQADKVNIGMEATVTDADGKRLMYSADVFANGSEFSIEDAKVLRTWISLQSPIKQGDVINWKSRFWDKNGSGEITIETQIKVK